MRNKIIQKEKKYHDYHWQNGFPPKYLHGKTYKTKEYFFGLSGFTPWFYHLKDAFFFQFLADIFGGEGGEDMAEETDGEGLLLAPELKLAGTYYEVILVL